MILLMVIVLARGTNAMRAECGWLSGGPYRLRAVTSEYVSDA